MDLEGNIKDEALPEWTWATIQELAQAELDEEIHRERINEAKSLLTEKGYLEARLEAIADRLRDLDEGASPNRFPSMGQNIGQSIRPSFTDRV